MDAGDWSFWLLQTERFTKNFPCALDSKLLQSPVVCMKYAVLSAEVLKLENVQHKLKTFAFKVKVVPYCLNKHISKGATFTLKVTIF